MTGSNEPNQPLFVLSERHHPFLIAIGRFLGQLNKHAIAFVSLEDAILLADRALVGGTSFFTILLIARFTDATQLGIYVIGISVLFSLVAFHNSLVWQPYIIQRHSAKAIPSEHAGALLMLNLLFSIGSILLLTIGALGFLKLNGSSEAVLMTFAVAGALPFVSLREFARLTMFAQLKLTRVALWDLVAAVTQLSALSWLAFNGRMSALSACVALGAASAITLAGWMYCAETEFSFSVRQVQTILKQIWVEGKWLCLGRVTLQVQQYIAYWVTMLVAGVAVTGVYAACMSIVSFLSLLISPLSNVLTPNLQLAWKKGGGPVLWHKAVWNTVLIASLILPFGLTVLIAGEPVMRFLFPGPEYAGHSNTLTVLTLVIFCEALSLPALIGLKTIKRALAIVTTGMLGAILSVVLVWALTEQWGLLGAASGSLGGVAIAGILRWVAFRIRVPKGRNPTLVMRALQDFSTCIDKNPLKITRLGQGTHAEIILLQSSGPPIWSNHSSLVTKLYKPLKGETFRMAQAEFDSLSNLHQALDGREINGWMVSVPRPLYIHKSPLALTMTEVPGRHIDYYAAKNNILPSRILDDAARAFATTMQQCWSGGGHHGDLGVHNVLFDIEAKKISFVDPGTSDSCPVCNGSSKPQSAQASDLAHVLYDVSIDVMDMIGSMTMRMRREAFIESVFHIILDGIESPEEKRRLLDEIWRSAQRHVRICLKPSWSLKGMWYGFVNQIVTQRISLILERLASQHNV